MRFRPVTPQDSERSILVLAVFIGLLAALLVATILFTLWPGYALLFCAAGVLALTLWNVAAYGYQCPSCQHQFQIGLFTAIGTPHVWNKKLLRCPACGKRDWASAIVKTK
ncbi:MAG TPA: hypothetical protein VMF29_01705 [Candidatus Edwardsbacteria bacterium]|nr:hypothetical protein [Candidatus Edwardsbacteria bacterium]